VAEGWEATYGADMESIFLLRIGSDILANEWCRSGCGEIVGWKVDVVGEPQNCSAGWARRTGATQGCFRPSLWL